MNILIYFSKPLNPLSGGTERVAYIISDYLKRCGYNVYEMPQLPDSNESATHANIQSVKEFIVRNSIDIIINESGNSDAIFLFSHQHIPQNVKIITHLHFDIFGDITSFYKSYYLPILKVNFTEIIRNIFKWIKMPINKRNAIKWKKKRYRYMYNFSDKIILLTPNHINDFNKMICVDSNTKVISLINPISYNSTNISLKKENLIIYVGRLEYPKRVDRILKAWSLIQRNSPEWQLCIVGDGTDKRHLIDLVSRLKLRNVSFEGQTDPTPYYDRAKILFMTSNYEGTPMVIYEAMSYGVIPIVMNSFPAACLMIQDGIDGIITKAFDINKLAEACIYLMNNPSKMSELSRNAIGRINDIDNNKLLSKWIPLLK